MPFPLPPTFSNTQNWLTLTSSELLDAEEAEHPRGDLLVDSEHERGGEHGVRQLLVDAAVEARHALLGQQPTQAVQHAAVAIRPRLLPLRGGLGPEQCLRHLQSGLGLGSGSGVRGRGQGAGAESESGSGLGLGSAESGSGSESGLGLARLQRVGRHGRHGLGHGARDEELQARLGLLEPLIREVVHRRVAHEPERLSKARLERSGVRPLVWLTGTRPLHSDNGPSARISRMQSIAPRYWPGAAALSLVLRTKIGLEAKTLITPASAGTNRARGPVSAAALGPFRALYTKK
eukprot:scaffold55970_cov57-Phaeocystis_antarctica.AAC.3